MADAKLADIAHRFAAIDIAMLSTQATGGGIAARPMSNNGQVEYDGTSYYFTDGDTRKVAEIELDPKVALGFTSDGFWANAQGQAQLIRDKTAFKDHWTPDIDKWFDQGVDTPGLVLIKIVATRIRFWAGQDEGEITI